MTDDHAAASATAADNDDELDPASSDSSSSSLPFSLSQLLSFLFLVILGVAVVLTCIWKIVNLIALYTMESRYVYVVTHEKETHFSEVKTKS